MKKKTEERMFFEYIFPLTWFGITTGEKRRTAGLQSLDGLYNQKRAVELWLHEPAFHQLAEAINHQVSIIWREASEKPIKQLQKCADGLMSAQGHLPPVIKGKLKRCEDETRALIKELEEE